MTRPTQWFDVTWMALVGGAAVIWLSQSWLYLPHYEWRIASAFPLFLVLVPPCVRMSSGVMAACMTSIWQHTNRKPLVVAVYILLIVLTAGWSRSAVARDNLWIRISNNDMCVFSSSDQAMQLAWYHEPVRWAGPLVSVSSTPRAAPRGERFSIRWSRNRAGGTNFYSLVRLPYSLTTIAAVLVLAVLLRSGLAGYRQHPAPSCVACDYDLTANVSGVCPECGTAIPETVRRRLAAEQSSVDSATKSDLKS